MDYLADDETPELKSTSVICRPGEEPIFKTDGTSDLSEDVFQVGHLPP